MDKDKDTTHNDEPRDDARTIRWDDVTIGQEALHMPPDLREDYAWLKSFVRDVCLRDIDLLMERLKELGIHRDKTTLSKILRGRYQRDMRGLTMKAPVLAADKFKEGATAVGTQGQALRHVRDEEVVFDEDQQAKSAIYTSRR